MFSLYTRCTRMGAHVRCRHTNPNYFLLLTCILLLHAHVRCRYTTPNSFGFSAEEQVQLDEQDISTSMCSGRLGWALSGAGGFRAGCACSGCS